MMEEEQYTENNSQLYTKPKTILSATKEDVGKEIKKWMEIDANESLKSYENAVRYIELKLDRPLSCLESTWTERQYVKTVLQLWLEKSLRKAFEYLDDEKNDISKNMSNVLSRFHSINSFEDIRNQLNDEESLLKDWCYWDCEKERKEKKKCQFLQLILEQEDLFKNTPRFIVFVNCYFLQLKTSCIDKLFSRCLSDIVKDETYGEKQKFFIAYLNKFLLNVNEEKNLQDILDKEEFLKNYAKDENKSGQDLMKKLGEMFCYPEAESSRTATEPDWLQTFLSNANSLSQDEWTPQLQVLTKETCKKFMLPETKVEFKEKDGKIIISIKGVVIFVNKIIIEMNRLKCEHPDVEEIKIVGLQSVHIDCDLDNDIWHGINIGIVTDKLIVDGEFCWNVSGKIDTANSPRGKSRQQSESGGNVHAICNEMSNGQNWTIVSDGGDGSAGYKWTKEEFEKSFPSLSTGEESMKTVLKTLEEILPNENRRKGENILPEHKGNFFIEGLADDESEITAIFYGGKKEKQILILIARNHIGKGGYGGDITIECFSNSAVMIPFTGKDTRRKPLTNVQMGVYEASGCNGRNGKEIGDVAFIHKFSTNNGSCESRGDFYGFDEDKKMDIDLDTKEIPRGKRNLYIKYEDKRYAGLSIYDYYDDGVVPIFVVQAVKKKAVIRQSLVQYFDQIDELKQLKKCTQKMQVNLTEHDWNSIDQILSEMENKCQKLHRLMTQRQRHQYENIQKEKYVKSATELSRSFPNPKIIGRRPVYFNQSTKNYKEDVKVFCLDELPTEDGIDSALHCLLGQMNAEGKFVCKDTNTFRKQIAKHIREEDLSGKIYNGVVMFVLRVNDDDKNFPVAIEKRKKLIHSFTEKHQRLKGMESQLLRWLNHDDNYDEGEYLDSNDIDKWNKAWENIGDLNIIKEQLLKEQEEWKSEEILKEEYAKYIESQTGTLGLAELEMLAKSLLKTLHIYTNLGSLSFQYKESFNYSKSDYYNLMASEYFIFYEGDGRWKRLSPNENLNWFCDNFTSQFHLAAQEQNWKSTYFTQLEFWIVENKDIINDNKKDEVNTSIEKFHSQNKTPNILSRLLFERLNTPNICPSHVNQLMGSICSLAEWVEYYNIGKVSPFFYLSIVESNEPNQWNCEFILLEMEERLEKPWANKEERDGWRKKVIDSLISHGRVLPLFTKIATKTEEIDILFSLNFNKLLRMLTVLEEEKSNLNDVCYSLVNLFYKQRSQFWEKRVDEWLKTEEQLKDEKKKEYVSLLLERECKNEIALPENVINDTRQAIEFVLCDGFLPGQNFASESRNVESIVAEMKRRYPKHKYETIENIVNESKLKKFQFRILIESNQHKLNENNPKGKIFLKKQHSKSWIFETILKKAKKMKNLGALINDGMNMRDNLLLEDFLGVFDYAVEQTMGFQLRDAQKVAIMTLLVNSMERRQDRSRRNTLAQVSTGEGKSIIVAGVAIGFTLFKTEVTKKGRNNKIDVITSNDVLAIRDSSLQVAKGGLKELYEFFNVTVANNCSQSEEDRKNAYNMDVVYGQLANFQRDYLLDDTYARNIKGDRSVEFVIIDEVDCMLLDRGNNVLYMSHDIPGMEMLESLYVFIWEQIRDTSSEMKETREQIKSAVLYDLYGQITKEDLNCIYAPLGQEELASERTSIWEHLIEKKVFDRQGRLLISDVGELTKENIDYAPTTAALDQKQLNSKIIFYLRTITERKRRICIPSHLLDFVDRHLDTWLDNARRALELKQDEDYVIDQNRSDTSPDLNPQVIIIDPDTGTDQPSSQWDGALHQFLQLKEGCKLTLQSLKSVFISNANYVTKYKILTGVSGTLGFQQEQDFFRNEYNCDFITIPTAFPKSFNLKPAKLLKTEKSWWKAIIQETRQTIIDENRSIVIFCRSIKKVNQVHKHLKSTIKELKRRDDNKRIHRYTRDYEKFEFENKPLDIGHIIITTNLAGRGTDIKICDELKKNGGLHICLTYFPENERVEEQAMGRAARKGEPGSGILILCESQTDHQGGESGTSEEWGVEKVFVMKEKREWKERQRISRLGKDFKHIERLEKIFTNSHRNLSARKVNTAIKENQSKTVRQLDHAVLFKVIHDSILDKWALWLDETEYDFKCFDLKQMKFTIDLPKFIIGTPKGLTPARTVTMAKHLAMTKSSNKGNQNIDSKDIATSVFNELTLSHDHSFYPAAFYYYAFILLKEEKLKKDEFVRTLRNTETILNGQIDMQNSFIQIHQSGMKSDQSHSFCIVDGYKKQKETNIKIMQYFLGSVQWLLGSHCSVQHLREAGNDNPKVDRFFAKYLKEFKNFIENKKIKKDEKLKKHKIRLEKVDEYFRELIKSKCMVCQLNDPNTIPSESVEKSTFSSNKIRSKIILQIADDYGVSSLLEEKLKLVFNEGLNEEDIEKKLKKEIEDKLKDHYLNPRGWQLGRQVYETPESDADSGVNFEDSGVNIKDSGVNF